MTISVIVPVYNVRNYIKHCVQSILCQTYNDFELLLIDDGSTDGSEDICDALSYSDHRIQVYHKVNGGLSDARNYGIDRARGEYLTFIDSDDYIAPTYLQVLYGLLKKYNADVACVRIRETTEQNMVVKDELKEDGVIRGEEAIICSLLHRHFGVSACGKLFLKKLFKQLRFPKGEYYEDFLTIPYAFEGCKKVAFSETGLYFYYQRPGSITTSKITETNMRFFDNAEKLVEHFRCYGKSMNDAFAARILMDGISRFVELLLFSNEYSVRIIFVKDKMMRYWEMADTNPFIPKTTRMQMWILSKSTTMYRILFKTYKSIKRKSIR